MARKATIEPDLEASPVCLGVSPNVDWPLKHRPGRTLRFGFGLNPMPRFLFVPFQSVPHKEGHLLADTDARLVRTGENSLLLTILHVFS